MRAVILVATLAACGDDVDPCDGIATCVALHVTSATVDRIDQLQLDITYGAFHATTSTQPDGGGTAALPLVTAIELTGTTRVEIGIVAAGNLAGNVLGTGAASTQIDPGTRADLAIELAPVADCVAGGHYCGGDKLAGDPMTVYTCNAGGVPLARGRCAFGCITRPAADDQCRGGGGTCVEGGSYCGGDKLDGDPSTLYRCTAGAGTKIRECPDGCVVASAGTDDYCR